MNTDPIIIEPSFHRGEKVIWRGIFGQLPRGTILDRHLDRHGFWTYDVRVSLPTSTAWCVRRNVEEFALNKAP